MHFYQVTETATQPGPGHSAHFSISGVDEWDELRQDWAIDRNAIGWPSPRRSSHPPTERGDVHPIHRSLFHILFKAYSVTRYTLERDLWTKICLLLDLIEVQEDVHGLWVHQVQQEQPQQRPVTGLGQDGVCVCLQGHLCSVHLGPGRQEGHQGVPQLRPDVQLQAR